MIALFKLEKPTKIDFTQLCHFRLPVNDSCAKKFPEWMNNYLNEEVSNCFNPLTGQMEYCNHTLNVLLVDSISRFDGCPKLSEPFNGKYGEFILDKEGIDQMIQEVRMPKIIINGKSILLPMKKLMGLVDSFVYKENAFIIKN